MYRGVGEELELSGIDQRWLRVTFTKGIQMG